MGNATFDVYAATETAGVASECQFHTGLHLFEDLVVAEVVDGDNQPVPPGVPGEKILVTVLFGRTQPLIRYEMSDSIISSDRVHCPCGRPYPLIEGVQGRVEEALAFPARAGGQIRVQPAVFHSVMDAVPAEGWQLVQEPDRLAVLLAGAPDAFDGDGLAGRLMHELRSRGVLAPQIDVRRVRAIPRTALGKAPLIKKSRGILIANAGVYDALSRLLLSPLVKRIAADVAAVAPDGARVLEVGCGPGLLSIRLGRQHGLEVTGLDLDPAMIARAQANTDRPENGDRRQPSFLVGDVAALAFPDGSFDLVVSTLSMHHWADPAAGLAEIGRVLRPGARALIWDFRPGARPHPFGPRHAHMPDPVEHTRNSPLRVVKATPWVWPWRFNLTQRIELVRGDGSPGPSGHGATSAETDSDPLSSPG